MATFTKLYLTNVAATYTPATIRGAWDGTAGAVTKALSPSKTGGGAITSVARAETNVANNYDVLLYRGVSGPLAAQTITGNIDVVLGVLESNAAANDCYHLHVYVTQGNSDTPRGTLLTNYVETTANEWPTTATGKALAAAQSLGSLAITAGDRLVVEIGYVAINTVTTSYSGTLNYGTQHPTTLAEASDLTAGSTAVTTLAGFLSFSSAITQNDDPERVSQVVAELANTGAHATRVSQVVAELANTGAHATRVSQVVAELANTGAHATRVSQVVVEVATPASISSQRISQLVAELGNTGTASTQVSQLVVEVAYTVPATPPSTAPDLRPVRTQRPVRNRDKSQPLAQWQYVTVSFGDADTDLVIPHTLTPPSPEHVQFLPLRSSLAATVYRDTSVTRRDWANGYIVLRSSGPAAQVTLLLWVAHDKRTLPW